MPSNDIVLNVRQIASYPLKQIASPTDFILLQPGLNQPYNYTSVEGLVGGGLINHGVLQVGGAVPPNASEGQIYSATNFISPLETGILFNCYQSDPEPGLQVPSGLRYLTNGASGRFQFTDAGFQWTMGPVGQGLNLVMGEQALMMLQPDPLGSRLAVGQVTVSRPPIGNMEVVTYGWIQSNALVRNNLGKISLTPEDIVNAGGATAWNAALAGYPTAQTPVPEAHGPEIVTAEWARNWAQCELIRSWNGRTGDVCLTLWDIVYAGGAQLVNPAFGGTPTAPTPDLTDSSTTLATTAFVHLAIAAAMGTLVSSAFKEGSAP